MEIIVRHEGQDHRAEVQLIKTTLWIHFNGRTFAIENSGQGRKSRKAGTAIGSNQVAAPMPGKITKILVKLGQEIDKGQAVLVMEAMKMEYTLKAEVAGKVADLSCKAGDQVVLGKVLAKIDKKIETEK
ncbi:MAG: acetyl-CoA carboxylase biotin carboxyl carrier protein subunit [Bdellovibrionaceae bacterium]|nr:acetyl-CoA carboxylase biotin carboxyl carrier protein subunit [Pseudobdellovibrionaceae bacterium]